MRADVFVAQHGANAIGMTVATESLGEYPGGPAVVTALHPDPKCPEIVMQVRHETFGEIGVFEYEDVAKLTVHESVEDYLAAHKSTTD